MKARIGLFIRNLPGDTMAFLIKYPFSRKQWRSAR
jgi:hypothetical protein